MVRYVVNQHMLLIRYVAILIYFTGKASLKNDDINGKICSKTIYLVIKKGIYQTNKFNGKTCLKNNNSY